uniref:SAC domain-containing protein n=1 Tax=Steinernema glaseri TaxID=37863 RepID=A0A1I7XZF7_9BILA
MNLLFFYFWDGQFSIILQTDVTHTLSEECTDSESPAHRPLSASDKTDRSTRTVVFKEPSFNDTQVPVRWKHSLLKTGDEMGSY